MSNGQYPPPPPGATGSKQGMPGWAKIAIGCGCLLLLIGVGVAGFVYWGAKKAIDIASDPAKMAEFAINANPDLEVVKNDKDAGTMTIKNTKTGEVTTVNYADIQNGKLTFEGNDGETYGIDGSQAQDGEKGGITFTGPDGNKATFGVGDTENVPSWVPLYPSAKETISAYQAESGEDISGLVTQTSSDSVADVKKYYDDLLAKEGYKITGTFSGNSGDQQGTFVNAEKGTSTLAVVIGTSGQETSVSITYKGPK